MRQAIRSGIIIGKQPAACENICTFHYADTDANIDSSCRDRNLSKAKYYFDFPRFLYI